MTEHYAEVFLDRDYLRRIADYRRVTREDVLNGYAFRIECTAPADCAGWEECREDHPEWDGQEEAEAIFHGIEHEWMSGMWMVPYAGCIVQWWDVSCDWPEGAAEDRPGRYLLDVDWLGNDGDTPPILTAIEEVASGG